MNILEFQAKNLCRDYGIPVPHSVLLPNTKSIQVANIKLNFPLILKSQVRSKNRAQSGGICLVRSLDEAIQVLPVMFDRKINNQNVGLILAEELIQFTSGYAISFEYDQQDLQVKLVTSQSFTSFAENGNQIQQIENKVRYPIDSFLGLLDATIIEAASAMGIEHENRIFFRNILKQIWKLFDEKDIERIAIDPLVISEDKKYYALGVDIAFDDYAIFRQAGFCQLYELRSVEDIQSLMARLDCEYTSYEGNICVLSRTKEMCATINDILLSLDQKISEMITIDGEISIEKMTVILNKIEEQAKSDTIIIHSVGDQSDNSAILKGLKSYLLKTKKETNIILRMDGSVGNAKEMENKYRNFFCIKSLQDISNSLRQIAEDRE